MVIDPEILEASFTQKGKDLLSISYEKPIFLVFLRHFGCTFCREALADISNIAHDIDDLDVHTIFVHMSTEELAIEILSKYNLSQYDNISDPDMSLYEYFGLSKGNFGQLYGLKVWLRGLKVGLIDGHGGPQVKKEFGSTAQLPGIFIIYKGKLIWGYNHKNASDRPDYVHFLREALAKITN